MNEMKQVSRDAVQQDAPEQDRSGWDTPDQEMIELAERFRTVIRHTVYVMRNLDADGGISSAQLSTLNMLAEEPLRMNVIARNSGIRVPSATEQVIRLEKAGLVLRSQDPADSRAVLVRLTPQGRQAAEQGNRRRSESVAAELAALSPAELRTITEALPALDRLMAALTRNLERGSPAAAGSAGTSTTTTVQGA